MSIALAAHPASAQEAIPLGPVVVTPSTFPSVESTDHLLLQLEVFVNDRPLNLISAFTLKPDGTLVSSRSELEEIGLRIPSELAEETELPLNRLPGLTFVYDEAGQTIRFTAAAEALKPTMIDGQPSLPPLEPARPPLGSVVNYTLFASGTRSDVGWAFDGLTGSFETRVFGAFGLVENNLLARVAQSSSDYVRLDSTYTYEDPTGLRTLQVGDVISGGFSWTRPIRLGGIQLRRSFGLRPDLITAALPVFSGSAATPSALELYVNNIRTLATDVRQGPFEIHHPPIVYGGGLARLVVRDALGRETVSITPFYASPDLLAAGLTDYSLEIGLARRNFAVLSNDYDGRLAASGSWRGGVTDSLTLEAHGEAVGSLALAGGGAIFTVENFGLASVAIAGSTTDEGRGALIDASFQSHTPHLSWTLRSQRVFGDYQDLASWTTALPPELPGDRRVSGQARELNQASVSAPLPWKGGSAGLSYVDIRRDADHSRLLNLSFTQDFGPVSVFASGVTDFERPKSTAVFIGLSVPLGAGITTSGGTSRTNGKTAGYVEATRQGHHEPGHVGWTVRASDGETRAYQGIVRYGATFARFEADLLQADGDLSINTLMEGAITLVGGDVHASQRVDNSFALVEVGAPGVAVLYENRPVGFTNRRGHLLVPNLTPFVPNRIAVDPANLPLDAELAATSTVAAPYSRSAILVDLAIKPSPASALVTFVDFDGAPIELGSSVVLVGREEGFVVGYDGEAFVSGLGARNLAVLTTPDGGSCEARFEYHGAGGEQVRIPAVLCEPRKEARR